MALSKQYLFKILLILLFLCIAFNESKASPPLPEKPEKGVRRPKVEKLHLFIIGNSFSVNASKFLPQLARAGGKELKIGRAELGGCSLQRHWEIAEAYEANPNDPKGRQYGGKSLKMLLSEGTWDVVTIQQNSMNSGDVNTYRPYAQKLYNYIKQIQPRAEVIMHQTWAYRVDAKKFGLTSRGVPAANQQEMWEQSRAAYHTIAGELGTRIMPVGDAFWRVSSSKKWHYQPDTNFNYANPAAQALPVQQNSLQVGYNWYKTGKFNFDPNHANAAGEYLGSLIWYACLFNEPPAKVKFVPEKVPANFAAYLRKVAKMETRSSKKGRSTS